MVMKTQLKVTYLPLIPTRPLFVTTNDHYWRYEVRSQAPLGQLDDYEAAAWNDYGANAGAVIKNLILSTWARPL